MYRESCRGRKETGHKEGRLRTEDREAGETKEKEMSGGGVVWGEEGKRVRVYKLVI